MLTTIIFFIAGIVLGLIGLRLLSAWETRGKGESKNISRHHS